MSKTTRPVPSEQKLLSHIDRLHELFRRLEAATAKQRQILAKSAKKENIDPG